MTEQTTVITAATTSQIGGFLGQVYAWMTGGLFLTATSAFTIFWLLSTNIQAAIWLSNNSWIIPVSFFAQLILVIALSALIERMSTLLASVLFAVYSLLMGVTLFGILIQYTVTSVFVSFAITGGLFLVMSIVGFVTKRDLTRVGTLALVGLLGVILATILNFFLQSTGLDLLLTYAGIFIFLVLIAYDSQKIKRFASLADQSGSASKYALIAALSLYLDFINLFIRVLSITGRRR